MKQANNQQSQVFKELIWQIFSLNCQFYPLPMVKEILSPMMFEQYYPLAPETIAMEANITVKPANVYENDDILRQQLDIRFRPCNFAELMPRLNEGKMPRSG